MIKFRKWIGLRSQWNFHLPKTANKLPRTKPNEGVQWIYYPSCLTRVFAGDDEKTSLGEVVIDIAKTSGKALIIPEEINSTCCSQPFSSKGYRDAAISIQEKTINILWKYSKNGEIPIVVDTSPCTYQFLHPNAGLKDESRLAA